MGYYFENIKLKEKQRYTYIHDLYNIKDNR